MNRDVEEVKSKLDIVELINRVTPVKKTGRNFKALCPFHQEKTPSFTISPERQLWHCFGACQQGGDAISFLMKLENISFYEALTELAQQVGVKLQNVDFEDQAWKIREKLFKINKLTADFYHYLLTEHAIGNKAREYLVERKINKYLITTFFLGYSPASWDSLSKFLTGKGYGADDLVAAGVCIKSDLGRIYDRFRKRIIFPLYDARGNIIGFSGRVLDDSLPKYVNTPETDIYHKRETLFGIQAAKEEIKNKDRVIVVEGELDMLACFREGIKNVIAVKGSSVTKEQFNLLKRLTKRVTLCLDADFAGNETTKRAIADAESMDFELHVATYDFGKDPDEAIKNDPIHFKKIIEKPIPIYDFIIENSLKRNPKADASSKKKIADEVGPFIETIKNPIVKSYYVKKLAEILDVPDRSVELLLIKIDREKKNRTRHLMIKKSPQINRIDLLQKYLLSQALQSSDCYTTLRTIFSIINPDDLTLQSYLMLVNEIQIFEKNNPTFDIKKFAAELPKELMAVFDELYLFDIELARETLHKLGTEKVAYEFKRLIIKKTLKETISQAESEKNTETIGRLMDELSQVEKKLAVL